MNKYFFVVFVIFISCTKQDVDLTPIDASGEILFISRRIPNSAEWQMFIMNSDGTNQRAVSNNLVRCTPPIISNSGTKVVFTTYDNNFYYNLFIIDIDGQNQKFLSKSIQFCGSPVWSPDDNRIAFVKNENSASGKNDIYSIKIDGSDEIKLTNQNDNYSPQYSPDHTSIIYTSSNGSWTGVYSMNIDGTNKRLLTPQNKSFGHPKFSPNGRLISISSLASKGSQIFVMNSDGSNLKQLTFTVSSKIYPGWVPEGNVNPSWSPNSDKLAYVSFENGSPDIFVINSNGKQNKRLTDTPLRDEDPFWSKDGKFILFSSNRNLKVSTEIYIMRTEGQLQTPLTNYIADDIYPIFINK